MTAKRFTIQGQSIKHNDELLTLDMVCEMLNDFHEENQDLKSFNKDLAENLSVCANVRISKDNRIERLEEKIQRERTSFTKTHERWSKEAETKIKELSDDNEQLKQELKSIEESFEFSYTEKPGHFDKDKLYVKDTHTKIHLDGRNLFIEVYIPQINEFYRFKYTITGKSLMREFIENCNPKGDME